ncbi:MAG: glycerate kinase [Bacteroidetes bacterium]|nr:glycerate kinase [Bacteroidota bacterium]
MQILIAPNAFKNSLDANSVALAIGKGLHQSKLICNTSFFPIGDGGDGTGELISHYKNGTRIKTIAHNPLGRKINSFYELIDENQTAVIELSNISGIKLLQQQELNPMLANTFGTGELIKEALDKGVKKIIICIGGSASVDGGTGALQALGLKFIDDQGNEIKNIPEDLIHLSVIDDSNFDKRILNTELKILCDVENVLLGETGAAKIFGPQKGADEKDIIHLEAVLTKFRDIILQQKGVDIATIKYGGAAGGVASGLFVFCNATLVNGIEYFLNLTGFDNILNDADLVITGEGKIDEQTLEGKGPYGIAVRAKKKNITVICVAGNVPLTINQPLQQLFDILLPINNEAADLKSAIENTEKNLVRTGKLIGDILAVRRK